MWELNHFQGWHSHSLLPQTMMKLWLCRVCVSNKYFRANNKKQNLWKPIFVTRKLLFTSYSILRPNIVCSSFASVPKTFHSISPRSITQVYWDCYTAINQSKFIPSIPLANNSHSQILKLKITFELNCSIPRLLQFHKDIQYPSPPTHPLFRHYSLLATKYTIWLINILLQKQWLRRRRNFLRSHFPSLPKTIFILRPLPSRDVATVPCRHPS